MLIRHELNGYCMIRKQWVLKLESKPDLSKELEDNGNRLRCGWNNYWRTRRTNMHFVWNGLSLITPVVRHKIRVFLEVTDAQWLNSWGLDCESTLRYINYYTILQLILLYLGVPR